MLQKAFFFSLLITVCFFSFSLYATNKPLPINKIDSGKISANGKMLTLRGNPIQVNQQAPNFKVADNKFSPVWLNDFAGKVVLINTIASLDTGVCSLQTKHFNDTIAADFRDLVILTISTDLPFAQSRFCQTENITQLQTLSDAVWHEFGANYGLLIENMGLLARSVIILDKQHKVVYKQVVNNLANEPDYDAVENSLRRLFNNTHK